MFFFNDVVQSVSHALQYISYYHPKDFIQALSKAYREEKSPVAKNAIAQILYNSKLCAEGHRPICQDTGSVWVEIRMGMHAQFEKGKGTLEDWVNEGVRNAYQSQENPLRASILKDPLNTRTNTKDNTPAVVHISLVEGESLELTLMAKGGGSENKAKSVMLNPTDSIKDWVLDVLPKLGAGWCPPGVIGLGVGGTADKAAFLAKKAIMNPMDMHELKERGAKNFKEKLRLELFEGINALGIGAQGLGGLHTVLDVQIEDYPTHAASLPVSLVANCAANRHIHFPLKPGEVFAPNPPDLSLYPDVSLEEDGEAPAKKVNLDKLTQKEIESWKSGDRVLLSGTLVTGRDAAHKKLLERFEKGEGLPPGVSLENKLIYYVGPVPSVGDEAVGPAGPTTSTRMDKFTEMMFEKTGILGMVGKAERGQETVLSLKNHKKVYLIAVGGAAYLVSKSIKKSKVVAFAELGMEAMHEFEVENMPVMVAVDTQGVNLHQEGPALWSQKIASSKGAL